MSPPSRVEPALDLIRLEGPALVRHVARHARAAIRTERPEERLIPVHRTLSDQRLSHAAWIRHGNAQWQLPSAHRGTAKRDGQKGS
jgi:hypothetical protein